jgi:hypothetical protein
MRLLQLSTASDEILDLHPNVTVVSGLDSDGRRLLVDTVLGLSRASAVGSTGLLEAHGVLFDLSDQMIGVLDVAADDLHPVVRAPDLPTVRNDPRSRERISAERAVVEIDERWVTAAEEQRSVQAAHDDAAAVLDLARRNATEADAGAGERIRLIDELTAVLDHVDERRRQLLEEQAALGPEADTAQARRLEVEAATVEVRTRGQEAAILCSELAGRLDEARIALDPEAVAGADAAEQELAAVEAEVEAERAADRANSDAGPEDEEPPTEHLARVQAQIEDLEKRLLAFVPAEGLPVADPLARLRARLDGELVPSPAALELADQLAVLEADLAATAGVGTTSAGVAAGRARLDEARHALTEAEQAVRNPELDREVVERLELAHADVLEALEKADGRFAGGRAQRRVAAARGAEQGLLDELGFGSYSDYMMGYSLLNVDPEKEAVLDAARSELSAAEDDWRLLEAEMEAELARAGRMERRRLLLDDARALLGRSVRAAQAVDELRALRVAASVPPELVDELQRSLDDAGVAVAGEDLSRDELMLLAEAWLAEADKSDHREGELRSELAALSEERLDALAAVEAEEARRAALGGPLPEEERWARVCAAREASEVAEARLRRHLEAEAVVGALTAELLAASDAERTAAGAASEADAAVAAARDRASQLAADAVRIAEELDAMNRTEIDANQHLQSLSDHEHSTPEELAKELADAEAAFAVADDRLHAASAAVRAIVLERNEAQALAASFSDTAAPVDDGSLAEEIEWYLLARLAAQRAVCLGGSLPLLLDGALDGLDEQQLAHVLGRLERMADAVQVIVVSDDPKAAAWANAAGQERAAVVQPQAV